MAGICDVLGRTCSARLERWLAVRKKTTTARSGTRWARRGAWPGRAPDSLRFPKARSRLVRLHASEEVRAAVAVHDQRADTLQFSAALDASEQSG